MSMPRLVFIACAASTLSAQRWTEEMLIEKFLEQNPLRRATEARSDLAAADTRSRTVYSNPSVQVAREGAGRTEFYQASQTLPLSGRIPLVRQAGGAMQQAVAAEGSFALWQARCGLRAAFYTVPTGQRRLELFQAAIVQWDAIISRLRTREREGEGSRLDRLRAEQERADIQAQMGAAEASLELSRGELLQYLPPGLRVDTVDGTLALAPSVTERDELVRRSLAARGDLEAERQRQRQFQFEQLAAQRLKIPEPSVFAGLKRADVGATGLAYGPVVGASIAIPVFNRGKAEVARYAAEERRTLAQLDWMSRRVEATIDAAWNAYQARRRALDRFRADSGESVESLLRIATLAYDEGEATMLQLLDAHRVRQQSQLRLLDLETQVRLAWIHLESQAGEELK